MCFHAENTRVLVYFSFEGIVHTTEDASLVYGQIILFLRNKYKIYCKEMLSLVVKYVAYVDVMIR